MWGVYLRCIRVYVWVVRRPRIGWRRCVYIITRTAPRSRLFTTTPPQRPPVSRLLLANDPPLCLPRARFSRKCFFLYFLYVLLALFLPFPCLSQWFHSPQPLLTEFERNTRRSLHVCNGDADDGIEGTPFLVRPPSSTLSVFRLVLFQPAFYFGETAHRIKFDEVLAYPGIWLMPNLIRRGQEADCSGLKLHKMAPNFQKMKKSPLCEFSCNSSCFGFKILRKL